MLLKNISCIIVETGVQDLIGSPDQKLQLLKASVLSNGGPAKLIAGSPELLISLEDYSIAVPIISEHNAHYIPEASDIQDGCEIDFTRVEDFFRLESKIDAKNDHSLLKIALSSSEGEFLHSILCNYTLPANRLAFIQQQSNNAGNHTSLGISNGSSNKEVLVSCQVCGEMFSTLNKFQQHILTHPDPDTKKFLCQICGKRFNRADHLNRHSVLHGNVLHKCLLCGEEFDRASHLDRHRRKNHPPVGQTPSQTPPITPLHDKIPCLSSSSLDIDSPTIGNNLHLLAVVATPESESKNSDPFSDTLKATLEMEQQRQDNNKPPENIERPYVCEVCDRKFIRSTHLRRHMRIHTGEKPFACHICGRRYARGDYLRAHINGHRRDRVHKCKHCNEIFHDLTRFADHCRQVHKDMEEEQEMIQDTASEQQNIDSFNLYDDIHMLRVNNGSVSPVIPLISNKIKIPHEVIMSSINTRDLAFHGTDFLQAFTSSNNATPTSPPQTEPHVVLQNGSLAFVAAPDNGRHEITIMTSKNETLLDPLEQLIITNNTEALDVLQHD